MAQSGAASNPGAPVPVYQPPMYVPIAPARSTNGMAIASMVLGILWLYGVGSILALIFGYVGLRQIRENNQNGRGMAIAGVVLGWVGVAGLVLIIIVLVAASSSSSNY